MEPDQKSTPLITVNHDRKIALALFLFVWSVLVLLSSARLVSSDEVSMFLTIESIIERGALHIISENPPNATIIDGRAYTWYEAGNILVGIPGYLTGKLAAHFLPLPESIKGFAPRATVSLTSTLVGAGMALIFFALLRRLRVSVRMSVLGALILVFSTFLLPYFKLYFRDSLLTLCLLGGFASLVPDRTGCRNQMSPFLGGFLIGYGILTKLVFALNLIPLLVYVVISSQAEMPRQARIRETLFFGFTACVIGLGGTAVYNLLRFSSPFEMGYTEGTTFETPFYVGMYGLLFSPGKGLLWFAPIFFLLIPSLRGFRLYHSKEFYCILTIVLLNLVLYSTYVAWGGDGSWGPRYLAPLIPLLLLPIVLYVDSGRRVLRRVALALAMIGLTVQIGGISIYAGAYLREIGEFPLERPWQDPEFMARAHFIPNYSPVIGHWRMLVRNASEHLRGEYPQLEFLSPESGQRLPVAEENISDLLRTLDFWFAYGLYAGVPSSMIMAVLAGLIGISTSLGLFLVRLLKINREAV